MGPVPEPVLLATSTCCSKTYLTLRWLASFPKKCAGGSRPASASESQKKRGSGTKFFSTPKNSPKHKNKTKTGPLQAGPPRTSQGQGLRAPRAQMFQNTREGLQGLIAASQDLPNFLQGLAPFSAFQGSSPSQQFQIQTLPDLQPKSGCEPRWSLPLQGENL